jgi:hypothetical protein
MPVLLTTAVGLRALSLDGVAGRVTCGYVPSGTVSIALWGMRLDAAAGYCLWGTQVVGGQSALLRLETNNAVTFIASTASAGASWSGVAPPPGAWAHYVLTYNLTTVTLYLNGANLGGGALAVAWNGGAFELGARAGSANALRGSLFGCRVWSTVLTAADVAALYAGSTSVQRGSLLLEWSMREGRGQSIADTSGAGQTGTLVVPGTAWAGTPPQGAH